LEILNGKDDTIEFEDFLGGVQYEKVDFHTTMEQKLKI
jgi:Proteasome maturation factor UMP1